MLLSSRDGSNTLGVGFLLFSMLMANVQSRSASEVLAVFDKPIQLFGNVSVSADLACASSLNFIDDQ